MPALRVLLIISLLFLQACGVARLGDNLPYGVLNNPDVELVGKGLPTYLLMMDGLIENWPERESLLRGAAGMYSAYAGQYVGDEVRASELHQRALDYARRAACARRDRLCGLQTLSVPRVEERLQRSSRRDVPALYTLGTVWAGWIEHNSGDWAAVADLARVQAILNRVAELAPEHEQGQVFLYLGALDSLLPAALGGQPERAREHFERAIEISEGANLMARVLYAERYARLMFDRELHDRLLMEVLDADPIQHGLTLQNQFARREAERLLAEGDEYF